MIISKDDKQLSAVNICRFLNLHESEIQTIWEKSWSHSQAYWDVLGTKLFIVNDVSFACKAIGMREDTYDALVEAITKITSSKPLCRLAWHLHYLLFYENIESCQDFIKAPHIPTMINPGGPLFYAIVLLTGYTEIRRRYDSRNIPLDILHNTLIDLELWIDNYRNEHNGEWGFSELSWLTHHFQCKLFQVGLLQYEITEYPAPFIMFANDDGERIMLAEEGCHFRRDGQFAFCDSTHAPVTNTSRSILSYNDNCWKGMPVSPRAGSICHKEHLLDASLWKPRLKRGDEILSVHISERNRLDMEGCISSFRDAKEFFCSHWPEYDFSAFYCNSWLLDPQFEEILPEQSNIRKFLSFWYLHPVKGASDWQTKERVFDCRHNEPENLPQKTSLQKILRSFLMDGGKLRNSAGVILCEDIVLNP